MKLKKLLKDVVVEDVKGPKDIEITGISVNSKSVAPGNLFIARKGCFDDGNRYISEAVDTGASAVATDIYNPSLKHVTQIIHPDPAAIEALLAANYYGFPSSDLFLVGITGTNGKTTTSFLIKHLLDKMGASSGLIGTIEYHIGSHRYPATRTTPNAAANQKMLREMLQQGCQAAVMEVSSHALCQGRVDHIEMDIAVFTNLTDDHLDYHKTIQEYAKAKQKLFTGLGGKSEKKFIKTAVVNADDPWHEMMIEDCKAQKLTYGIKNPAHIMAKDIELKPDGTRFTVSYQGRSVICESPLIGRFNVYNVLAAFGVGLSRKIPLEDLAAVIKTFSSVPGRMEKVSNNLGINIFADFAHSGDSLRNVLESLNELKKGRILTVFGAGGDRDPLRRKTLAEASEALSDFSIITSDNPRSEDPNMIVSEIASHFKKKNNYHVEVDRKAAISHAIDMAKAGDIILIAGRGHETAQIFAHHTIEFDDRKVAEKLCMEKQPA